jgi:glycerol uptake facilitator-like aquaporin
MIAAALSWFILDTDDCHHVIVQPISVGGSGKDEVSNKWFAAMISETIGTFFFCFLFMLCTDKATQFSQDRVINCFIIASSFCSSRLLAGGTLVTGMNTNTF